MATNSRADRRLRLAPEGNATFTLRDVTIGINFHWERKEDQTFEGGLRLLPNADGTHHRHQRGGRRAVSQERHFLRDEREGAARAAARPRDHVPKLARGHARTAEAVQERRRPGPARARE